MGQVDGSGNDDRCQEDFQKPSSTQLHVTFPCPFTSVLSTLLLFGYQSAGLSPLAHHQAQLPTQLPVNVPGREVGDLHGVPDCCHHL